MLVAVLYVFMETSDLEYGQHGSAQFQFSVLQFRDADLCKF